MDSKPSATESANEDAMWIATILEQKPARAVEEAYTRLLRKYWKVVMVLTIQRVNDHREAEDIAQEAFIRAFRSLRNLEHPVAFLGWLLRIVRNLTTDHIRSRRPHISLDAVPPGALESDSRLEHAPGRRPPQPDFQKRLEEKDELEQVLEALSELPERYREVVTLKYLQGLDGKSMAKVLDEPEGTVRNRCFRALEKIRKKIEKGRLGHS
jgi:RNA polymerase sigma-70 factor (ECF subfamily)